MTSDILPQDGETWRIQDECIVDQSGDVIVRIDDLCRGFTDAVKLVIAERIVAVMNFCQDTDYTALFTGGLRGVLTERDQIRKQNKELQDQLDAPHYMRVTGNVQSISIKFDNGEFAYKPDDRFEELVIPPVAVGDVVYTALTGRGEVVKVSSTEGRICWDDGTPGDWYSLARIIQVRVKP